MFKLLPVFQAGSLSKHVWSLACSSRYCCLPRSRVSMQPLSWTPTGPAHKEKAYLGSQLWWCQSMVSWLCCFRACGKSAPYGGSPWTIGISHPHGQEAKEEEEGESHNLLQVYVPRHLTVSYQAPSLKGAITSH